MKYMYISVIEAARTVTGLEEIWYGCSSNKSGCSLLFKTCLLQESSENNEKHMQENIELSSDFIACIVFVNSNWGGR